MFILILPMRTQKVFHMMGKPDETKHLVVAEEQAVISQVGRSILESEQATIPLFGQCAGEHHIHRYGHGSHG